MELFMFCQIMSLLFIGILLPDQVTVKGAETRCGKKDDFCGHNASDGGKRKSEKR